MPIFNNYTITTFQKLEPAYGLPLTVQVSKIMLYRISFIE